MQKLRNREIGIAAIRLSSSVDGCALVALRGALIVKLRGVGQKLRKAGIGCQRFSKPARGREHGRMERSAAFSFNARGVGHIRNVIFGVAAE